MEEIKFNKYIQQNYILDCGLEVQYFPYSNYHTNTMGFIIPYGSNMTQYEVNGKRIKTGIAHFLEHRMFDSPDGDFSNKFALIGASSNAFTYFDRTVYYCSTSEDALEAFKMLFDLVNNFYSTKEKIKNESQIIVQEMLDDLAHPPVEMSKIMNHHLFNNSSFKDPIIGTRHDIESTTLEDLQNAFNAFYDMSNMILVVVGPTPIEPIIDYINKHYVPKKQLVTVKKIGLPEDFSQTKFNPVHLTRDVVEKIQGINFKVDISTLSSKVNRYKYDLVMDYGLSLLFDIGSNYIELFNSLDVGYNSFNYQYVEIDNVGLLSIKYLSKNGRIPNKYILDALNNPEKYIDQESLDLYSKRMYGKKLMILQDPFEVFQAIAINVDRDYNFLELFKSNVKITLDDIFYFIKYLGKGIILKGVLNPKEHNS